MAGKITPQDSENGATAGHNIAAINETIRSTYAGMLDIENNIDKLMETHIKPLKDQLKEKKRNLKADTDLDSKDLTLFYNVYKRQERAKAMEDEDAGRIADNLRTIFGAMHGQLDFVDAMEQADVVDIKSGKKD